MESEFIKSELISLAERMSRDHTTLAVAWLLMGTVSQIHSESEEQKDELIHWEHSLWRGKGRNTCTIASRAGGDKMAVLIIEIGTIKEKLGTTGKVHGGQGPICQRHQVVNLRDLHWKRMLPEVPSEKQQPREMFSQ